MINLNSPIQTHKYMASALFIEHKTRKSVRKKTLSQTIEFGTTSLTFLTIVLVAVVSLAYLAHTNKSANLGSELRDLEAQRTALISSIQDYDMAIASATSLAELDPKVETMIAAENPLHINSTSAVASLD